MSRFCPFRVSRHSDNCLEDTCRMWSFDDGECGIAMATYCITQAYNENLGSIIIASPKDAYVADNPDD